MRRSPALADLASATAFLTVVGRGRLPTRRAVAYFPVVGMALGGALGALWWAVDQSWPAMVAGGLVVVADAAATGMLHLDAVADAGDGLLAHLDRDRRLRVMREPVTGAFGVSTLIVVVLLRWAVLSSVVPASPGAAALLLGGLWATGRTVMVLAMAVVPSARADSLAGGFAGRTRRPAAVAAVIGLGGSAAALVGWEPRAGGIAFVAALAAGAAVVALARRRVGGITGDVLGAAGVAAETIGLVMAAVHW